MMLIYTHTTLYVSLPLLSITMATQLNTSSCFVPFSPFSFSSMDGFNYQNYYSSYNQMTTTTTATATTATTFSPLESSGSDQFFEQGAEFEVSDFFSFDDWGNEQQQSQDFGCLGTVTDQFFDVGGCSSNFQNEGDSNSKLPLHALYILLIILQTYCLRKFLFSVF